jgi:hypothetical protein
LVTLGGLERDDQCRIHRERIDNDGQFDQSTIEQRFLTLCGAYELKGHTLPASQEERTRSIGTRTRETRPRLRLGALLYCSVDAREAL